MGTCLVVIPHDAIDRVLAFDRVPVWMTDSGISNRVACDVFSPVEFMVDLLGFVGIVGLAGSLGIQQRSHL